MLFSQSDVSWIDWAVCGGYLLLVLGMSVYFARRQHSHEDYFFGGRRMHWIPIGLSVFAGMFSSLSFVGMPREGAYDDYHLYLAILFIPLFVMPLTGWLFVPVFHRLGADSPYKYLGRRFGVTTQRIASVLFMFYILGWMGNLLLAMGVLMQAVLGITDAQLTALLVLIGIFATFYTVMGGVQAVVWTDVLQSVAMAGGMLVVLLLALNKIDGGIATVLETAGRHGKFEVFDMRLVADDLTFWQACAFGMFVYLAGYSIQFPVAQRYMSMPTVSAARRSLAVNGVMTALVCALFFFVGTALFTFYHQGLPEEAIAAGAGFPELPREDHLLPHFILTEIPYPGLVGMLVAALFAAGMSSIDTGVNSLTATIVYDWLGGRQLGVWRDRCLSAALGVLPIGVAILLQWTGGNVFDILIAIASPLLGLLLGPFLLGVLSPRSNQPGVLAGLIAGFVALIFANFVFNLPAAWYGAVTVMPTLIVGYVVSLAFPPPREAAQFVDRS